MSRKPERPRGAEVAYKFRSYLSVTDLTAAETRELIRTALLLKARTRAGRKYHPLAGRTLAMIFQKPSLRTRVSFETGMNQLGGHALYLGPDDIRLGDRESVEDAALTLSRMADLIMARVFAHSVLEGLARHATVPVVNGLSDREHPCQILGDLLTIVEHKGGTDGIRVAFVGDGNNVCHSLLYAAGLLGMSLAVAGPSGDAPDPEIVRQARVLAGRCGGEIRITDRMEEACRGADVVYTDVWTSMGRESEAAARRERFMPYQVNDRVMALARPNAILMHCLPAHYGEEIDYATARGPHSVIFDQAENRLHAQKALLVMLAG
jgi:ornithine carbamoyltransferase